MKDQGRIYPCYETPEELERKRKLQLAAGGKQVYDRAALKLTDQEKKDFESDGRKPHWRFLMKSESIKWNDILKGEIEIDLTSLSDPVLFREDGVPLYTFSSAVDDIDFNITNVIRGDDHTSNTAVQIELINALDKNNLAWLCFDKHESSANVLSADVLKEFAMVIEYLELNINIKQKTDTIFQKVLRK